ncbi:MAG: MFS transporter [Proteobacteria bacterium]|nr:MFS transporter [Pseudomonadota bacterium]
MTPGPIPLSQRPPPTRPRIRWRIYLFLFGFGMIAYIQARSITVAGVQMMPQLGLTAAQLGWLETAFLVGYTGLQFPGGVIGQRLGARATFVLIGIVAVLATLATPLAPWFLTGGALFAALLTAQLVLGASQGPIFPVSAGVFEAWFTPDKWPLVQGVQSCALGLGAALAPPLITQLMAAYDWQRALLWIALPPLAVILWWGLYARNTPEQHPKVSAEELAELGGHVRAEPDGRISGSRIAALFADPQVLILTGSYLCMNYVYYLIANWCFLYLVQERHFTMLEGGVLAAIPPLAAAAGAGVGGQLTMMLVRRRGVRRGLRVLPLISLPAAGLLQFVAVDATNAYVAVGVLALCFFCVEVNEGPYWTAIMHTGRADTMAAAGILNTGGNLGGIVGTPIVGYLAGRHDWTAAFLIGTAFAFASAAGWLLVDPERRAAG